MSDNDTTLQSLKDLVEKFRAERNWGKHHTSKNLAVSIAIEAAELLEHYQWDDLKKPNDEQEIAQELADIVIYCLNFAVTNNIDISQAVKEKIDYNTRKYPVTVFNESKDDAKDYWQVKISKRESNL